ncbi:MAG: SDR family oxidoreductase [Proteobacteria bacterium]|nr:SDR family oxidoreductase [Pseudomonadota bacterium]
MYDDLKGKVALVTGAGRPNGLGQGIAKRLAREGCRMVICDIARPHPDNPGYRRGTWEELDDRRKEIEELGVECLPVKCDVTDETEVEAMFAEATGRFGGVDVLVNNVGVGPPESMGPLVGVGAKAWDEAISVNLKSTHLCSRAAALGMIERGRGGSIVSISSQAGKMPFPGLGAYCAGKAGVLHYTRVLALELASHKIRVNAVLPGTILTDQLKETFASQAEKYGLSLDDFLKGAPPIPLGRYQTPEDVAAAVTWFASDQSGYVTGVCLLSTGGQTVV